MSKKIIIISIVSLLFMNIVYADNIYTSENKIVEDSIIDKASYKSSTAMQNALLVEDGSSIINNISLYKTGDYYEDKYGINSGLLVTNGVLNINGGIIKTEGKYSNAISSYKTGIININNVIITTNKDNSNGIMAYSGNVSINNADISTFADYSCAIKNNTDSIIKVDSGTYKTNGLYSPVVYATSDITINNSTLESKHSEGIVVDGSSVILSNSKLINNHDVLDKNIETYKNIYILNSDLNTSKFYAIDSEITTNSGYTFYTNANSIINLTNNKISNNNDKFLKIYDDIKVTLNLNNQKINGNIEISNSSLDLNINNNSVFSGFINNDNEAKDITLNLDLTSKIILTNDSYINKLNNETSNNSNIYLNGYKLYVNGIEIEGNNKKYEEINNELIINENATSVNYPILIIVICLSISIIVIIIILIKNRIERFR